jgi:hypothetical protein
MSLEGPLRELGLQEVCQLLALSRKSGVLHVRHGRRPWVGRIAVEQGLVVFADVPGLVPGWEERQAARPDAAGRDAAPVESAVAATRAAVEELCTWRDGDFRFAPQEGPPAQAPRVRLATDALLMDASGRADHWAALSDRIPHAGMIPAFVEVEPVQLPLLHLVPEEWEVLTQVDGLRDLRRLALALGRDDLAVARVVHGLLAAGMLTLRDLPASERAAPTPPSNVAIPAPAWGGTPAGSAAITDGADGLLQQATRAARSGDFAGARAFWQAYLAARPWADDAPRIAEAIDLVARLEAVLAATVAQPVGPG